MTWRIRHLNAITVGRWRGDGSASAVEAGPLFWKGEPVTYLDPDTGKVETLLEMRAPAVAARAMEMMMKKAGLDLSHTAAEQPGEVVYTLKLDSDLRDEDETDT